MIEILWYLKKLIFMFVLLYSLDFFIVQKYNLEKTALAS